MATTVTAKPTANELKLKETIQQSIVTRLDILKNAALLHVLDEIGLKVKRVIEAVSVLIGCIDSSPEPGPQLKQTREDLLSSCQNLIKSSRLVVAEPNNSVNQHSFKTCISHIESHSKKAFANRTCRFQLGQKQKTDILKTNTTTKELQKRERLEEEKRVNNTVLYFNDPTKSEPRSNSLNQIDPEELKKKLRLLGDTGSIEHLKVHELLTRIMAVEKKNDWHLQKEKLLIKNEVWSLDLNELQRQCKKANVPFDGRSIKAELQDKLYNYRCKKIKRKTAPPVSTSSSSGNSSSRNSTGSAL